MDKQTLIEQINQGLSTWKMAKLNGTSQTTIRNKLKKYGLKTLPISKPTPTTKTCPCCRETKNRDEFYKYKKSSSFYKKCILEINKINRQKTKKLAIEYKGGKCIRCGYNRCDAALDFHHVNPKEKEGNYFRKRKGFTEDLRKELDKCVLVCSNCHREIHSSLKKYHTK